MMANLPRLELAASPCAEILSFQPQHTTAYGGAAATLKVAQKLQAEGQEQEAEDIRGAEYSQQARFDSAHHNGVVPVHLEGSQVRIRVRQHVLRPTIPQLGQK